MSQAPSTSARLSAEPEPTWEVAYLFPTQGDWSEHEYLALETNRLIEFSNGRLEFLPMPTTSHEMMVFFLSRLVLAFAEIRDHGSVLPAGVRVRLWRGKFRQPDVVFMLKEHEDRIGDKYWRGADLVMEVVSADDESRKRDLVAKRRDYARAGITEYWIIDPQDERITVLRLSGKRYIVHGEYLKGAAASSHLLKGFVVDCDAVFSQRVRGGANKRTRRRSPE